MRRRQPPAPDAEASPVIDVAVVVSVVVVAPPLESAVSVAAVVVSGELIPDAVDVAVAGSAAVVAAAVSAVVVESVAGGGDADAAAGAAAAEALESDAVGALPPDGLLEPAAEAPPVEAEDEVAEGALVGVVAPDDPPAPLAGAAVGVVAPPELLTVDVVVVAGAPATAGAELAPVADPAAPVDPHPG